MPFTKPSTAVFDSAHATASNVRCFLACTEGVGVPFDIVSYSPPHRWDGSVNTQTGPGPTWIENAFEGGYALRLGPGCPAYVYRNRGLTSTWATSAKTFFGIVRHHLPTKFWHSSPGSTADMATGGAYLWGCGWSFGAGPYIAAGSGLLGLGKNSTGVGITAGLTGTGDMVLYRNRWYGLAVVVNDTGGTKTRTFFLYDFESDTYHQLNGQVGTDTAITYAGNAADFLLNIYQGFTAFDIACCGMAEEAWDSTDFSTWIDDPFAMARGTYSPSGTHAFPYSTGTTLIPAYLTDHDDEQVVIQAPRAIGADDDHVYTFQRSETLDFTGTVTDLAHNGTTVSVTSTPNGLILVDKSGTADTTYGYRLRSVSAGAGTTITTGPCNATLDLYPPLLLGVIGTSISTQVPTGYYQQILSAPRRRVTLVNRGKAASSLSSNWRVDLANTGQAPQLRLACANGQPTSGEFTLQGTIGGTESLGFSDATAWGPTAAIAYNATTADVATAVQTAIRLVSGYGSVTVAGSGTAPATGTTTLTLGNAQAYVNVEMWSDISTSTLAGGTQVWGTKPVVACYNHVRGEISGTAGNTHALVLAQFQALGLDRVSIELGTNDSTGVGNDPTTSVARIAAIAAAYVAAGFKVAIQVPTPYYSSPPTSDHITGSQWIKAIADAIADLDDDTDIFAADADTAKHRLNYPFSFYSGSIDGVHPDAQQYGYYLTQWSEAINAMDGIDVAAAGGGGGIISMRIGL